MFHFFLIEQLESTKKADALENENIELARVIVWSIEHITLAFAQ